EEASEALRSVGRRGTPVYVLRSSSLLHLLFFNWSFWRLGLPIARAATGLGYRIFAPFARWYLGGEQVHPPAAAQDKSAAQVIEAVRQGEAALVFLRMPRTLPSAVAAEQPQADAGRIARQVRGALYQHLAREARVITGPPLKSPQRVIDQTLNDLQLRRTLAELARERGRADDSLDRQARKNLREIAARYKPLAVDLLMRIAKWMFRRIYDGVDVDEAGMRRLAEDRKS